VETYLLPELEYMRTKFDDVSRVALFKLVVFLDKQFSSSLVPLPFEQPIPVRSYLALGLADESEDARSLVRNYFDEELMTHSIDDPEQRILVGLSELYHPALEPFWSRILSLFLMYPALKSPSLNDSLYDHPLKETDSKAEMNIDPRVLTRDVYKTPLFSQESDTLRFSPSQALFTQKAFSQTIANFGASQDATFVVVPEIASTFSFDLDRLKTPWLSALDTEESHVFSKRFDVDQSKATVSRIIQAQDARKRYGDVIQEQQKIDKRNAVTIIRSYKDTDLPDIQIPRKDILLPLINLCQDSSIANLLCVEIVSKVFNDSQDEDWKKKIINSLLVMISRSKGNTDLMSFAFRVGIQTGHSITSIPDPDTLYSSCQSSRAHHLGIVFLEEILANPLAVSSSEKAKTKKRKLEPSVMHRGATWFLGCLFGDIGDQDAMLSCLETSCLFQETLDALRFFDNGKYLEALQTFESGLAKLQDVSQDERYEVHFKLSFC
jgi:hypothetical protein